MTVVSSLRDRRTIGEGPAQELGETPNLAAILQTLAEPGAVVIAAGTDASGARPRPDIVEAFINALDISKMEE